MPRKTNDMIHSRADLDKIKANVQGLMAIRESRDAGAGDVARKRTVAGEMHVMLCFGTGCISSGAVEMKKAMEAAIKKHRLADRVRLVETGCNGFCAGGPIVVVYPGGTFYHNVGPDDAVEIVKEHLVKGRTVDRLLYHDPVSSKVIPKYKDIDFFAKQNLRVLHNKGLISAESMEEYIGRDGYFALSRALTEMTPDQIVEEMKKSGLRGRGGAGFPTGVKWELCRKAKGDQKYILCNADEGDPGAFMDRSLIESDAHAVLEGMMIGARAVGASIGYIYCRAEYPLALERLNHAIAECRRRGLLGKGILGTDFNFDVIIAQGSGAFVCGEETALMRSIEGKRGEPRPRPPFPANKGLWDKPSVLNNVETFGNVPLIIRHGADWFRSVGTGKSTGTKIFALTGKVNNVGLVEVNMGTPLGNIIYDIGGGIPGGKKFKAAQIGGPSGGCITKENLNVPVDYESVAALGAIMGSGGLIVMDEDTCMVDMARFFLEFTQEESCGKCVPCRVGTKRMLEILERICEGKGKQGDVEALIDLGSKIKDTALCGLGQTAPNPVLSTIRYFRDEYEAHIRDKKCPAGVCHSLVKAPCTNACPAGVHVPGFVSLVGEKRYDEALLLHRERNPLAAVCAAVCFHPCESKCRRSSLDAPLSVRAVKRFMIEQEKKPQIPEVRANAANARRKMAVIGAGPAGLSCAYFLARLGYKPTVFEAHKEAGGMLVQTIPAYRLPREMLAKEVRMIRSMGVTIQTGQRLGRDFTLKSLREKGFEAVFVGVGAPLGSKLGIPGENMPGVADGVEFLREYNLSGTAKVGRNVAVIGGGNVAVDVARTALRLGAKSVTLVYRRTRDEMPAYKEEVEEALREGVKIEFLVAPTEIAAENGLVTGLRCTRMELGEFDRSGRRRPKERVGDEFEIEADQVIGAIGQSLPSEEIVDGTGLKIGRSHFLDAHPVTGQTSVEWIFAGGDAVTGPSSVIGAIAAGERAAVGMDQYLTGASHAFWRTEKTVDTSFDPDADPVMYARPALRMIPVSQRKRNFKEVELPLSATAALREAKRCLRCDYREASLCEK
jgi:NADH-quinone oxidoreductase subunit F